MKIPDIAKYLIAILIVIALAEAMPEVVNAVLVLVLVGILLMRFGAFQQLVASIGSLGK